MYIYDERTASINKHSGRRQRTVHDVRSCWPACIITAALPYRTRTRNYSSVTRTKTRTDVCHRQTAQRSDLFNPRATDILCVAGPCTSLLEYQLD